MTMLSFFAAQQGHTFNVIISNGTVVLTGTAVTSLLESDVITGGKTIIATISDDTWLSTLGADNAATTAWLAGITSDQTGTGDWNTTVRDVLTYSDVTRTSDTICTLILPATLYDPVADETITHTVDASSMTSTVSDVTATPTFTVTISIPAPGERSVIVQPHNRTLVTF